MDVADETTRTQVPEGATGPDVVTSPERGHPLAPDPAAGIGESSGMAPSFAELVWAHFLWRHQLQRLGEGADGRDLEVPLERAYRRKLAAFEARNGRLVDAYWCRSEASAVAITCRDPAPFQSQRWLRSHRCRRASRRGAQCD